MPDLQIASTLRPPNGEAARDYLVDMIKQLAKLARNSGEIQLAIILEAAAAVDRAARERIDAIQDRSAGTIFD